jgi:hypothetical protein
LVIFRYDEEKRLNDRYVPFDISNLQKIAGDSVSRRCVSIKKFAEGFFNREFLLTMDDGFEVIAKIPYRSTVPARYLIASEVATMDFLRKQHELPVLKVYAWSAEKSNPVGVEYILTEKASGVKLADVWCSLNAKQMLKVIAQLVQCEAKLLQSPLSHYGSIYFTGFLSDEQLTHPLDNASHWCVGPIANRTFWHDGRDALKINRGPCKHIYNNTDNRVHFEGILFINN